MTLNEWVDAWDAGKAIPSVRMSPAAYSDSYELAIQVLAVEMIRGYNAAPRFDFDALRLMPDEGGERAWLDFRAKVIGTDRIRAIAATIDASGMQLEAAMFFSGTTYRFGLDEIRRLTPPARHITITKPKGTY